MKKHKSICKSKQKNCCFAAAQDLSSDKSDEPTAYEGPTAIATLDDDDDARNIFD